MTQAKSGYERVVNNLVNLPETKAFIEKAVERFQSPRVLDQVEFDTANYGERNYEDHQVIVGLFTIQYGPDITIDNEVNLDATKIWRENVRNETYSFSVPSQESIGLFVRDFLNEVWSTKRCKTYNCKDLDRVRTNFRDEVIIRIRVLLPDRYEAVGVARDIVIPQIQAIKALPGWKEAYQEYMKNRSKLSIIRALKEFPDVSDDIFHEALHEFISERVVDD